MLALLLALSLGQSGVQLYDEGQAQGFASRLNCVGSGIACFMDGGWGTVQASGGSATGTNTGDQTKTCGSNSAVTTLAAGTGSTCVALFVPDGGTYGSSSFVPDGGHYGSSDFVPDGGVYGNSTFIPDGGHYGLSDFVPDGGIYGSGNGTLTAVTATYPIASSGGTAPIISVRAEYGSNAIDGGPIKNYDDGGINVIDCLISTASRSGCLAAADWATFNGKLTPDGGTYGSGNGTVTAVSGTPPIVSSGGATPAISCTAAGAGVSGCLTSVAGAFALDAGLNVTGAIVASSTLGGSNFSGTHSGTHSGTSSGTNSGDVTLGTANGLSLASQALSMTTAGAGVTGAVISVGGFANIDAGIVSNGLLVPVTVNQDAGVLAGAFEFGEDTFVGGYKSVTFRRAFAYPPTCLCADTFDAGTCTPIRLQATVSSEGFKGTLATSTFNWWCFGAR